VNPMDMNQGFGQRPDDPLSQNRPQQPRRDGGDVIEGDYKRED